MRTHVTCFAFSCPEEGIVLPKRRLRNLHNIKNCVKMSIEVGRITFSDDDEELDRLLQNVKLMVPDSGDDDDGGNEDSNVHDSQVSLFATVRSPTDLSRSETGLAPGEGSNGERRNGGGPCQRPAPGPNNKGSSATPSQTEQPRVIPETPQNTPEGTEMETDAGPGGDVANTLSEKAKLRKRLLRAEHHHMFLDRCRKARMVPTGLKLNRNVHPIKGDGTSDISVRIEAIIKQAETDIVDALMVHYRKVTESTSARLTEIEGNLSNRSLDEREEITVAQSQAEREEDVLRSSLERTRSWKWSKLNDDRPPARSGSSRSGPRRHRVDSTPYSRRAPRWSGSSGSTTPVPPFPSAPPQPSPYRAENRRGRYPDGRNLFPQLPQCPTFSHTPPPPFPPSPFPLYAGMYGPQWGQGMMSWPGPQVMQPGFTDNQLMQVKSMVKEVVSDLVTREKHTQSDKQEQLPSKEKCVSRIAPSDNVDPVKKCCTSPNVGNVVNLSSYRLSPSALSLLQRGLSFIPSPQLDGPHCDVNKALTRDLQTLKEEYIDRYTYELPKRACRILQCCLESIRYDFGNVSAQKLRANLPTAERKALRDLIRNPDLIISKADKGDSTVVMSTEQYLELACKHLYDSNTYQLLRSDPTQDIVRRFNLYIEGCLEKGVIDKVQHERLLLPEGIDTQTIYFLPKIHKRPVKLRPIVSCTNGPTYTASAFLDKLLQPHMRKVKSFLKNSTELIHILRTLKFPPQAYLITLDVESLYTNTSHEEAIKSLLKRFECDPQKVFVLDLLKYVLKNNVFKFGNQVFAQLHGVAMGTKLAPALATIYIGDLEEQFLESRVLKPELWVRYIDDVFLVWAHPLSEFEAFLQDLNKTRERIRFTAEVSLDSCNFLDLTIYKSPKFLSTGLLSTKIYYKATNTFSYPSGDSYMPTQIHRSIAIGEMIRLLRNTEDPTIFRHCKNKLIKHFARRK